MNASETLNAFFAEMNKASADISGIFDDLESVIVDAPTAMMKRKDEVTVLSTVLAMAITYNDEEAISQILTTFYMLGYADGKKGESE